MMIDTTEKTAVVTGGSGGLGAAICTELVRRGYGRVISLDCQRPVEPPPGVTHRQTDLTVAARYSWDLRDLFGEVDLLVNNAGIFNPAYPERMTMVNVAAPSILFQLFQPACTVNLSSAAAFLTEAHLAPKNALYGATKAGLNSLTRSWAISHPDRRVFGIAPFMIKGTGMTQDIPSETVAWWTEHFGDRAFEPSVEHVAEAVRWIAEEAPSVASGTCYATDLQPFELDRFLIKR